MGLYYRWPYKERSLTHIVAFKLMGLIMGLKGFVLQLAPGTAENFREFFILE